MYVRHDTETAPAADIKFIAAARSLAAQRGTVDVRFEVGTLKR
jgi:hypothetical protein